MHIYTVKKNNLSFSILLQNNEMQDNFTFHTLPKETSENLCKWLLLDNQLTIHSICNPNMLSNIKGTQQQTNVISNGEESVTNQVGYLERVENVA